MATDAADQAAGEVDRCPSCNVLWSQHAGLQQTCADLLAALAQSKDLDGAMFSVWLHGDWRWLTRNMTTPEKEAAAAAVLRHDATLNDAGAQLSPGDVALFWWRDAPQPQGGPHAT